MAVKSPRPGCDLSAARAVVARVHDRGTRGPTPGSAAPPPAVTTCDACGGIAHTGFDEGFGGLVEAARSFGVGVTAQHGPSPADS